MGALSITRLVVLVLVLLLSIVVLGLAAHLTNITEEFFEVYFIYAALSIAAAGLTILTVPVLIIVDIVRRGAFTSFVVVELSWLSLLWVLWLATGAYTGSDNIFGATCDYIDVDVNNACHETNGIEGISLVIFILLFIYTTVLLVFAIIGSNRGHHVWTNTVKDATFLAPAGGAHATGAADVEKGHVAQPQVAGTPQPPYGHQNQANGAHTNYAVQAAPPSPYSGNPQV